MKNSKIYIQTSDKKIITYDIEIPETDDEASTGLAYRKSLDKNKGMLYEYNNSYYFFGYPQKVGMYTPQTEIPVDFIFIDNVCTIIKIVHSAKPLSKHLYECYCTGYVLELNAGECKTNNINVGDIISFCNNFEYKFKPISIKNADYFKYYTDIFCKDNENGTEYVYTYKSHCWAVIVDNCKEDFKERLSIISKYTPLEKISEKEANTLAINTDISLLKDLKNTRKKYYQASSTLFFKYDYQTNVIQYYNYKKGWTEEYWIFFPEPFLDMKWKVLDLTSTEVKKKLDLIHKKYTKKQLSKEDVNNYKTVLSLIRTEYPVGTILYKTKDTSGWYITQIPEIKTECLKICRKNKKEKKWYDYKFYTETLYYYDKIKEESKVFEHASYIHEHTNLVYLPSMRKYFLENEIIPFPRKAAKNTKNFVIDVIYNPWKENLWDKEIFDEPMTSIRIDFLSDEKKADCTLIAEDNIKSLRTFVRNIKSYDFAIYSNFDYSDVKLLAWKENNNIRFMVQYYLQKVKTPIDILVPEKQFYTQIESMLKEVSKLIRYNKKKWNETNNTSQNK